MAEISIQTPELHGIGRFDFGSRIGVRAVAAGTLVTLATMLLLATLCASLGLATISLKGGPLSAMTWVWLAVDGVIAGYLGGYAASVASRAHDRRDGLLHGFVTWSTALVVIGLLMAIGHVNQSIAIATDSTAPFAGFFLAAALALCADLIGGYYGVRSEVKAEAVEREKAGAHAPPAPKMA